MSEARNFNSFRLGQFATFTKTFTEHEFSAFSTLSLDANPLHADPAYAAQSEFGSCVVPLHMVAAPLSAVAGMAFPGRSSLIVREEMEAVTPVFFGTALIYSARVVDVSESTRTLGLRVIVFRECDCSVVLRASMRVKVREDCPRDHGQPFVIYEPQKVAIVTGAAGAIGTAISRALVADGWDIVALARRAAPMLAETQAFCERNQKRFLLLEHDLLQSNDLAEKCRESTINAGFNPSLIIHAASAPLNSDLSTLCSTNYEALRTLSEAYLPHFLCQQHGRLVFLGSMAQVKPVRGMEQYAAAKALASAWLDSVNHRYGRYNVSAVTLAPGMVDSAFSARFHTTFESLLQPEEVADAVVGLVKLPDWPFSFATLNQNSLQVGHVRFYQPNSVPSAGPVEQPLKKRTPQSINDLAAKRATEAEVESFFRRFFGLGDDHRLDGVSIGGIAEWDSLRHIELILGIENAFRIRFDSAEVESTFSLAGLVAAVKKKSVVLS